jgi:hypothetical protein
MRAILAEFAPVPNVPSDVETARLATSDVAASMPAVKAVREALAPPAEIGGPTGPEPTRFGDWEKNGRCIDF